MAYLIDGNNFLGHISFSHLRDARSKYSLVLKLLTFQRIKRTRIFLVFDGTPDLNFMNEKFNRKKFSIAYPSFGEDADSLIKELISKQRDLRKFFVVSSDRDIRDYARAKGAKTLSSKEFNSELRKVLKENRKALDEEKKVAPLSSLETNLWLEIFKKKND